jgi:hypothetical protein
MGLIFAARFLLESVKMITTGRVLLLDPFAAACH